ncbi:MAG TPA: EpsI family protein [Gemmatimonadales bacterium]
MREPVRWLPSVTLGLGVALTSGLRAQHDMPLAQPLDAAVAFRITGFAGEDATLPENERRVAGVSSYVLRNFVAADTSSWFSVYVGYYSSQTQGQTIHSPKNCLPGAGWEALASQQDTLTTDAGPALVNRYLIQNGDVRALVLYWYQGRGRVAASEYAVKWNLLRDAAFRGRTEEALVRIVVPIEDNEAESLELSRRVAQRLIPAVAAALPAT